MLHKDYYRKSLVEENYLLKGLKEPTTKTDWQKSTKLKVTS
jgi:hypothetical protein